MNISHSLPTTATSISFSFLSSEDIRRISVKQIVNPVLLNDLGQPNTGGLYDPALGPSEQKDICSTCRLNYFTCPGHYGHIELPAPVIHPLFIPQLYSLLRCVCMFCHRFKMSRITLQRYSVKLRLLEHGLVEAAEKIDDIHMEVPQSLPPQSPSTKTKGNKEVERNDDESADEDITLVPSSLDKPAETPQQFITRLELLCRLLLQEAKKTGATRDDYKDGTVYQMKKDLIQGFYKDAILKKCQNIDCACPAYTFRKEGHTKIVEYDLSKKQKGALHRKRPDVLKEQKIVAYANAVPAEDDDDSDAMDVDEGAEPSDGDDDEDEDGDETRTNPDDDGPPRAITGKAKSKRGRNERLVTPEECRAHLRRLFRNETRMCALLFGRHGPFASVTADGFSPASPDMFFMDVLGVPPTRFRPPARMGDMMFEHPQNELLSNVLATSYRLRDYNIDLRIASEKKEGFDAATRKQILAHLLETLIQLQVDVNSFMDSNKNPAPMRQGKTPPNGVKQGLEKKEGLFRKHMMGKRVNYAARSVISPDVNIEPHEIGIPPVFAQKLTFPEPVTPHNLHELRQRVINGPKTYPGATMVEMEDGTQISLLKMPMDKRTAIANRLLTPGEEYERLSRALKTRKVSLNKKVYRHLRDGDILILNRQPTLHKPSMMCHFAKVLPGEKTIRMHYANCNSYNADFDGDEMNIHFPQNEVARAEAEMIANTSNQYLVPTSGNPLRGLIQDHVVAGVWMTCQETFFEREEYFQLLYGALRPEKEEQLGARLRTLPPAIWKPKALWTGKQLISTVLLNITPSHCEGLNLNSKTKVPDDRWGNGSRKDKPKDKASQKDKAPQEGKGSLEDKVIFRDGELLCGVLDKAAFGASDYGLVHSVYELYGPDIAGNLLGILSRLFTKFLQHRAFTCRMDDLILTPEGNSFRDDLLSNARSMGTDSAIDNFPSLKEVPKHDIPSSLTSLLRDILRDDEKMAGLDMTVKKKLSKLTTSIEEACLPKGLFRQFPANHMQTMTLSGAKGSGVNVRQISCGLGQQELEGRRVPVMVSGKTLPSFRPFETKAIAGGYVASRFLTGVRPQEFYFHCMAGREGLIDTAVKTSRSGYLQRCLIKHLEGIRVHYDNTVRGSDSAVYQFHYGGDGLDVTKQKHLYQFEFIAQNEESFISRLNPKRSLPVVDEEQAAEYMKGVVKKIQGPKDSNLSRRHGIEPALSKFNPTRYLGSTSEQFAVSVHQYVRSNPHRLIRDKKDLSKVKRKTPQIRPRDFRLLTNLKYMKSLVEPGEAVGLLASQGVGEPSTQMTLNTFHFAGHGAANVTLGIPRLREIVMTAARKPKTPSMLLKVQSYTSQEDLDTFCKKASRVTLSKVVDSVTVNEEFVVSENTRYTQLTVDLHFFPEEEYLTEYDLTPSEILDTFGIKFPLVLKKEVGIELKKLDSSLKSQFSELGKGKRSRDVPGESAAGVSADDDDDDDDNGGADSDTGDGDAGDAKRARQKKQEVSYEDDVESDSDDLDLDALEAQFDNLQDEDAGDEVPTAAKPAKQPTHAALVKALFKKNFPQMVSFKFTPQKCTFKIQLSPDIPKLLFVGIVEKACRVAVIREIPGISDCFQSKSEDGEITLTTNGSNFTGLRDFTGPSDETILVDDEIYSNDIWSILKTYGVEMARAAILREMSNVFGLYNIDVNRRHLELIADYMTFDGGYKPFNRKGISTHSSPLLKASFETTAAFLSEATLSGDFDDLTSPSGNIVLGRPNKTGTGVFDIVMVP
ncbi:hypothetical protein DL96DRAFT_1495292 [Flagelloscypha sp. PMI_526]|nr:hypothetical protein DL96DRAFT_1495292 [Flagelloscypha sp. PMI_526]